MLYFNGTVFSPTPSVLTRNDLEEFGRVLVPAAEGFDNERLEKDALRAAVFKMRPVLCRFPRFDGSGGGFGCPKQQRLLSGGDNAYVEGEFSSIVSFISFSSARRGARVVFLCNNSLKM